MKMTERLAELERTRARVAKRRPGAVMERRLAKAKREREVEARREVRRATLDEEDRLLAANLVVPTPRAERVVLAHELLKPTPGGRQRTKIEVAAMMGVSPAAVHGWVNDPDGTISQDSHQGRARAARQVRQANPELPHEDAARVAAKFPLDENMPERLRRMRKAMGLSQLALAREIGTSRSRVCDWEAGVSRPGPTNFIALLKALGLD